MASESQLSEANSWPAQSYAASFFQKIPSDERFLETTLHHISPTSTISGETIEFKLQAFTANNVWLIQDTHVKVGIKITKEDGSVPAVSATPMLANNIVHSMFKDVKLYLNDILISTSSNDYHYKSYISTLLTFPQECKDSFLQTQGFYLDTAENFGNSISNLGGQFRQKLFHEDNDSVKPFKNEPVILIGRVLHELLHCKSGIAPGVRVKFEFFRSADKFLFINEDSDKEKYHLHLSSIDLYVPVAVIRNSIYAELNFLLTKKQDSANPEDNALSYHFRRLEIKPFTIAAATIEYQSDSLFSDSNLPARIVVCFVNSKARHGDYTLNPFFFPRHWDIPIAGTVEHLERPINSAEFMSKVIDAKLSSIEEKLQQTIKSFFPGSSNSQDPLPGPSKSQKNKKSSKKKSKKSSKKKHKRQRLSSNSSSSDDSNSTENTSVNKQSSWVKDYILDLEKRGKPGTATVEDFYSLRHQQPSCSSSGVYQPNPTPTPTPKTKRIFIRSVNCTLNGTAIDQFPSNATAFDDMETFWRMFYYNGQANSMISNTMSYKDFLGGSFFTIIDLSTSGKAGNTFVSPSIRQGHLRLNVLFSESIPHELTMLVYSEFPSTIYINHRTGKVTSSYFSK